MVKMLGLDIVVDIGMLLDVVSSMGYCSWSLILGVNVDVRYYAFTELLGVGYSTASLQPNINMYTLSKIHMYPNTHRLVDTRTHNNAKQTQKPNHFKNNKKPSETTLTKYTMGGLQLA